MAGKFFLEAESSKSTILEVSCQLPLITGVGAGGWFFTVMTILAAGHCWREGIPALHLIPRHVPSL
jgi:hypothetical protein